TRLAAGVRRRLVRHPRRPRVGYAHRRFGDRASGRAAGRRVRLPSPPASRPARPDRPNLVLLLALRPVEAALPVYVANDLHAHARLLGAYWTSFGIGALVSTLLTGTLRSRATRRITLLIVAGWGACLIPFAFAPIEVTLICFAVGGVIYGPFLPITYALFQSITTTANLPTVLAPRSAALLIASPLGMAARAPPLPPPAPGAT